MKRDRIQWLLIVIVGALIVICLIAISLHSSDRDIRKLDLDNVIRLPLTLRLRKASPYCEDIQKASIDSHQQLSDQWPYFGVLPTKDQLKSTDRVNGCIRTSIAVYEDSDTAETISEQIMAHNTEMAKLSGAKTIFSDPNSNMAVFAREEIFKKSISDQVFGKSEELILVLEKCNTVVVISALRKIEWEGVYSPGMKISVDEIVGYGNKISDRIDKEICPLVNAK